MKNLLSNKIQVFNQINPNKDISNIFTFKKNVNKKFTEKSYQIRFGACYVSVSKKFCYLNKNKQNYLIGIKPNYIYNIYDAEKNLKEKITGNKLIKKYNLISHHFLTVEKQRFINMQKTNPFLMQFKNTQESIEWHRQQVAKEREKLKIFLMNYKKKTNIKTFNNNIIIINNNDYKQKNINYLKKKKSIDINQLLTDLDDPIFC